MKIKADVKLVPEFVTDSCTGCIFVSTSIVDNSMCHRINSARVNSKDTTCENNMVWVIDEKAWNSFSKR